MSEAPDSGMATHNDAGTPGTADTDDEVVAAVADDVPLEQAAAEAGDGHQPDDPEFREP